MVMEIETSATLSTTPTMRHDSTTNSTTHTSADVDMDDEFEATQRLDDEPEDETPTSQKSVATKPTPSEGGESFDFKGASASAQPFAAAFDTVWGVLQKLGWQTAQGPGTEFVSMPGTQFFNFRPNINVFDSKGKACWKWLALAAERETEDAQEAIVWETLWTIAESQLGWYTMSSGNETWFVKPNTQFTEFQPNVTIFQTKKRAVLQAFAVSKVKIELGDSVEGEQVIDFAAKPEDAKPKAKKAGETPNKSKSKSDAFTTPPPKKSASGSSSSSKKTPSSSAKKTKSTGSGRKATPPAKKNTKSPKVSISAKKKTKEEVEKPKAETPLQFKAPEFKCTFSHVYKTLQDRGWYHKPGPFEYDYFSPDYTKDTQILNGNYFQSAAEFEGFLKDSGMWLDIENELREEHAALVEELRQEAEQKRQKQRDRQAAKESASKSKSKPTQAKETKTPRSPLKKKKSVFQASLEASNAAVASAGMKRDAAGEVKITMGKVVERLVKRGWYYKPGRFEYDYFKPNITVKNGKAGEDYFQSLSELEEYLKTTELWDEISDEIRNGSDSDDSADENPRDRKTSSSNKKPRVASPPPESPREELRTEPETLEPGAAALSNDIWGNSHQIDFEKY